MYSTQTNNHDINICTYNKFVTNTDDSPSTEMWEQIEYDSEPTPRGGGRNCHLRPRKVKTSIYFKPFQKDKEKENACNQNHIKSNK